METLSALNIPRRIAIIGSGNVATHLARALDAVADVAQIYSPDITHARRLAATLRAADATDDPASLIADADLYLIAVSDDAVRAVAASTPDYGGIWAHTSGSVPADALASKSRYGVFYPLQTFSREAKVDVSDVPMLIEASDAATHEALTALASRISRRVTDADSSLRSRLHVAAVFACNYANYMWTLADDLLRQSDRDITILSPLLRVTLDKALTVGPEAAQTGPARRGDRKVIEAHIASLPDDKAEVYRLLSSQIIKRYEQD